MFFNRLQCPDGKYSLKNSDKRFSCMTEKSEEIGARNFQSAIKLRRVSQYLEIPQRQGYLKIQIIDSGIGISKENIDKLFRPFVQAETSTFK